LPSVAAAPIDTESRGEPLPAARKLRWPRYAIVVAGLALALAAYEHFLAQPSLAPISQAPDTATVTVPVTAPLDQTPAPAPTSAVPTGGEGGGRDAVAGAVPDTAAGPGLASAVIVGGERSASLSTGKGEILLNFDGDSWVEVRDQGGNPIFSQLNRRGTEQRVTGTPPLVVVIGNARGVRLTYNDRRIDLDPHTRNAVARVTLE
jgi:cytoskeleton protein RodZ